MGPKRIITNMEDSTVYDRLYIKPQPKKNAKTKQSPKSKAKGRQNGAKGKQLKLKFDK